MCCSRILFTNERRLKGDFDFSKGTMLKFFQFEWKLPVEREELNIKERGREILEAVLRSIIEEIPSGPGAVSVGM